MLQKVLRQAMLLENVGALRSQQENIRKLFAFIVKAGNQAVCSGSSLRVEANL